MAERPESQDEVLAFLADPTTNGGEKAQRIDTQAHDIDAGRAPVHGDSVPSAELLRAEQRRRPG